MIFFIGIFFLVISIELVLVTIIAIVLMHLRGLKSQPPKAFDEILRLVEIVTFCRRQRQPINRNLQGDNINYKENAEGTESIQRDASGNGKEEQVIMGISEKKCAEYAGNSWEWIVDVADRLFFYVFFTFCTLIVVGFPTIGTINQQLLINA